MIRCLAVDDEPLSLDLLEDNISKVPFLQLTGRCKNAFEALSFLQTHEVDLLFLDIQMPGISGIQLVNSLSAAPMVIFITAYENFALEGFNVNAIDYLMKPVPFERFLKAVNKANDFIQGHKTSPEPPSEPITAQIPAPTYFFVSADYNLVRIALADILYIEGLKDYVKIHSRAFLRPVITRMSMKVMEEKLPADQFIRVHKSFIIALDKITSMRKNKIRIGEEEVPVSDFYKENLTRLTGEKQF